MAGVLSRSAARLAAATARPATALPAIARPATAAARPSALFLTVTRHPSAFAAPHAAVQRFVHTGGNMTPEVKAEIEKMVREAVEAGMVGIKANTELTPEVKDEIARMVREAVEADTIGMKAACLERFEKVTVDQLAQKELIASRHAEAMIESVQGQKKIGQIAFGVCFSMVGFAAASQYKAELSNYIIGGGPPSQEEVVKMVKHEVRNVWAEHFVEEQSTSTSSSSLLLGPPCTSSSFVQVPSN